MALRELLARFGFEVDTKPLEKADKAVDKTVDAFSGLGSAIAGAALVGGIYHFTQGLIELGSELDDQSNRLGISSDELQAWRFAAGQAGATAEEMGAAVKILTKNLAEAADGGAGAAEFQKLGIKVKDSQGKVKDATSVIGELAEAVKKADTNTEKAGIALKFFGKGGLALLPMLRDGKEGVEALFKRFEELGGGLSKEFVKAADDAGDAQAELGIAMTSLKSKIGVQVLPIVTNLVHKLTDVAIWVRKVTGSTNTFRVLMGLVGSASIITGLKLASGVAAKFGLIKAASGAASSGIMGTVRSLGALLKAGANLGLKLAILFLVLEDLYTLFTGGHSAIGALIDGFFGVGASAEVVKTVKALFFDLVEVIKLGAPALKWLGEQTKLFLKDMFSGFKGYGTMFEEFFHFLGEDIKKLWDSVIEYIMSKVPGIQAVFGALKEGYNAIFGNTEDQDNAALLARRTDPLARAAYIRQNGGGGPVNQTNNTEINVNGAGNPGAVAGKVNANLADLNATNRNALGSLARP